MLSPYDPQKASPWLREERLWKHCFWRVYAGAGAAVLENASSQQSAGFRINPSLGAKLQLVPLERIRFAFLLLEALHHASGHIHK